ncbi:P-loop NTPase family protein [Pedobacter jamesrossensis]|uniref:CobQ/CobB/MinD/ParA nucleotide binding domain-containing protein n=1 Tax=Pedobacter jamesrossensis TaxID=1908238 RepID=A0ABV8NQ68_9SPHI
MIISSSNLKGGCGCSSLLMLLAHYLSGGTKTVYLIDLSLQGTLDLLYNRSLLLKEQLPFEFFRSDIAKAPVLIGRLMGEDSIILLDIPKTFGEKSLHVVLEQIDRFIIPFRYELIALHAATGFSLLIKRFACHSKSIFLPNMHAPDEFPEELWENQEMLRSIGQLSAAIPTVPAMMNPRSMGLPPACLFQLAPALELLCNQYLFNP